MSSPRSSSSATAARRRSSRPRPLRRSTLTRWSAAAVTAAALYAFPWSLAAFWFNDASLYLVVDVIALVFVAIAVWSPLSTLAGVGASLAGAGAFFLITAWAGVCGRSALELAGVALALTIGAAGVRRGAWAFAAVPVGWIVAALWLVLLRGGTGGCFE